MVRIRYVCAGDKAFWFRLDGHLGEQEFDLKVRDRRGYIICDGDTPIGVMRYNLFWDNTPFLTLIYIEEPYRRKGFGKQAMLFWENEMRTLGYQRRWMKRHSISIGSLGIKRGVRFSWTARPLNSRRRCLW